MSETNDTIAAIATPRGSAGVGIIRVSGPRARCLADIFHPEPLEPRKATLARIRDDDGNTIDEVLLLFFPAPYSFTGEDVLELQGHGGIVIMDMLLEHILGLGCRQARPGEFSERAFLNDKIDLVQAEAIADLIESHSRTAVRGAMRSLQGDFSRQVNELVAQLISLRTHIEAWLDFPDEEIDTLPVDEFARQSKKIHEDLADLVRTAHQGQVLREGLHLVLAGKPNAGKSSLLNRLTRADTAIVSDIPGTTRDIIRERIHMDGIPVDVTDTAGLRETADAIESEGVERAKREMGHADRVLLVVDDAEFSRGFFDELEHYLQSDIPLTIVRNKIDLSGRAPGIDDVDGMVTVALSAKTGEGMPLLLEHLKQVTGMDSIEEGVFTARQRHLDALRRAQRSVRQAHGLLSNQPMLELAAEDLRQAQQALAEITGEFSSDDLLGEIFGSFCIGK